MSNNDNASTIDQSVHDSSQCVSELKTNMGLNNSSPVAFNISSPNVTTDNDMHWLRFSIAFGEYQDILQPKSISSVPLSHHSTHSSNAIEHLPPPLLMPFSPTQSRLPHNRDLRPQSTGSISPQSYCNTVTSNATTTINAMTMDLSTSPPPTTTTRYSRRYAYVSSPTNTLPESGNEMISIDQPIHTRISNALNSSGSPANPSESCSLYSKSRLSLSKLKVTLANKHESAQASSHLWPPNRKISPTVDETSSSFEVRKVETSDSETVLGMEPYRSEINDFSINNARFDSARRPRRSSLFAGRDTYIDVERSVMQFPIRPFQPLIGRSWWNGFLFDRWFLWLLGLVLLPLMLTSIRAVREKLASGGMYINSVLCLFWIITTGLLFTHWIDLRLLKRIISGWDFIYMAAQLIIMCVTGSWMELSTSSTSFSSANIILRFVAAYVSHCLTQLIDAIPRSICSRRLQITIYLLASVNSAIYWIQNGFFNSSSNLPEICTILCISLVRLNATVSLTLALLYFKFFLSLLVWPKSAILIKARLDIE